MSVVLTISETVAGANVNDTLSGLSTGIDFGQASNSQYTPLISQAANTGHQDIFIRHNSVNDPITSVKLYISQFSGTYGGANTAAADFTTLSGYGAADSGANPNNADGLSRGLHMDMDWQVSTANQFSYSREATGQKRIFGKTYTGKDGLSLANAFDLHVDAMSYWNGSSEVDATTPVTGSIGRSIDTVLGNRGHFRARGYLHNSATEGGILQWDSVISYSYTS